VRELQNAVERAVITAAGPEIGPAEIALPDRPFPLPDAMSLNGSLKEVSSRAQRLAEKLKISQVLAETGFNRTRAAEILDLVARNPVVNDRFRAAVRVADRRWNIRLSTGADVLLPEGAEAPALERLASLQASHALLDRGLAAVDMRLPDRLVLRPLEAPEAPQQGRRANDPRGRG